MLIWGFRCCHVMPAPLALLGSSLTTSYGTMQPTICFSLTRVSSSFTQDILLTHHFSYATNIHHRSHCTYLPGLQLQSIYMPLSALPDQVVPCDLWYSILSLLNSSGISARRHCFQRHPQTSVFFTLGSFLLRVTPPHENTSWSYPGPSCFS